MVRVVLFFVFFSIVGVENSLASCKKLKSELVSLKKANHQVIKSLVENQELMSNRLNDISIGAELNQGQLDKNQIAEIRNQAKVLKNRNLKSQKLAEKLDDATDELLKEIAKCVK